MTTWTKNQSFINQTDVSYGGEGVLVMKAIIYEKESIDVSYMVLDQIGHS